MQEVRSEAKWSSSADSPSPHVETSEECLLLNSAPRVGHRALLALACWLQRRRDDIYSSDDRILPADVAAAAGHPATPTRGADRAIGLAPTGSKTTGTEANSR